MWVLQRGYIAMTNSKEIFGRNLRNKLDAKRKNQNDLARYLNVTPTAVSRWVNGEAMPRANMLDRICFYLNCTAEDLMTDHTKTVVMLPQDIIAEEIENDPRLMRIMFYCMKMSDAEKDKLIERLAEK